MRRRYELDMCRIFACLMVVMLHVAASGWYINPLLSEWQIFNIYDTAVRAGVPLFFMISGALFLERDILDVKKIITKNILRLLIIYFTWSILYELNAQWIYHNYSSVYDFTIGVINGHYHLGFLPTMVLVYLTLPIMHRVIHGGQKEYTTYIFVLFLIIVLLKDNLLVFFKTSELIQLVCEKIDISMFSYSGYMIVGYILSKKKTVDKCQKILLCILPFIWFLTTIVSSYATLDYSLKAGEAKDWLYGYFSLPVFIQACCIFIFFQCFSCLKTKYSIMLKYVSDCTLGIYLIHPMILESFGRHGITVFSFNPVISVPLICISITCLCLVVVSVLKKIPLVKSLI